jgi:VanZ family protein
MMALLFKAAFWLLCALVTVLSLLPVDQLPSQALDIWDKAQHAVGFMLLAAAGLAAYPHRYRILSFGLLAFGAAIELAQSFTTWRQGDGWDWIADAVGIALVMLLTQCIAKNPATQERYRV